MMAVGTAINLCTYVCMYMMYVYCYYILTTINAGSMYVCMYMMAVGTASLSRKDVTFIKFWKTLNDVVIHIQNWLTSLGFRICLNL